MDVAMDVKKVGAVLRTLREQNNKSLDEAAADLEVSKSALAMYERGERVPRDGVKVRIARYYNQSIQSIFFAEGEH